jgi:hypothetical protein
MTINPDPRRPRPYTGPDTLNVLHQAIELLALLRGIRCPITDPLDTHDPAHALHLAWSISLQIDAYLPNLITDAHDHGHSWDHIRTCFDPTPPR